LGQLHLELALARASALRKNVQDQRRPIQNFAAEKLFQVSALGRRQLVVKDHGVDAVLLTIAGELLRLA